MHHGSEEIQRAHTSPFGAIRSYVKEKNVAHIYHFLKSLRCLRKCMMRPIFVAVRFP